MSRRHEPRIGSRLATGTLLRPRSESRHALPAPTHENHAGELMLDHLRRQAVTERLELVLVDRGVTAAADRKLGRHHDLELRRVGWDDKQPVFRPIRHAWRVEVGHGRLGRSRRPSKSFENTTTSATGWLQVACIATTVRHLSRPRTQGSRSRSQRKRSRGAGDLHLKAACQRNGSRRRGVRMPRGGRDEGHGRAVF
jgi:hypothetical protein